MATRARKISSFFFFGLFLGFWPKLSTAIECYVVSGIEHDKKTEKYAFDHAYDWVEKPTSLAGSPCVVVAGWTELNQRLSASKSTEPLFVLQLAHGDKGGVSVCDGGKTSAGDALMILNSAAEKRSVSAFLQSCYSGDILKEKLQRDERGETSEKVLNNLCLAAASPFGVSTRFDPAEFSEVLRNTTPGESAESVFKKNWAGVISSAAWSGSGAARAFISDATLDEVFESLKKMAAMASCDPGSLDAKETWKQIVDLRLVDVDDLEIFRSFKKNSASLSDIPTEQLVANLKTTTENIKAVCAFAGCDPNYLSSLEPAVNKVRTAVQRKSLWSYDNFKALLINLSAIDEDVRVFSTHCDLKKRQKNILQALPNTWGSYATQVGLYSQKSNQFPDKLSEQEVASLIITVDPELKRNFTSPKRNALETILGLKPDNFNGHDQSDNAESAHHLLRSFVRGSLDVDLFTNPNDRKRRHACREFKL